MPQAKKDTGPTLTDITTVGRKVVKYGAIGLVALMVGRFFLVAFVAFWRAANPPPPPPPTVGFGTLPRLRFPAKLSDEKPLTYKLETATGDFPDFGDRAKVFFMPKSASSLLADERVRQVASEYGFIFEPEILDQRTYRWHRSSPLETTLELDVQTLSMDYQTDFLSRPELLQNKNLPDDFRAVNTAKEFLSRGNLLPEDVATASGKVTHLKALGAELATAASFSDADFVRVDLNRVPIEEKYLLFTPEGNTGSIQVVLTGGLKGQEQVVMAKISHQMVDYSQLHTYPLRTAESAWKLLQAGEGYVAQKGEFETAVVRSVQLGYYEDTQEQDYLQPIYVFTGDGGFIGYVSALDPTYLENIPVQEE